ncbi:MAG: 6-phosphofructokinase 1 [Myxococcota bacterium]|jgi:6-phosphofructokinase 1
MKRRVGICTGGGDAPGLNAVIRAFVRDIVDQRGWEAVGIADSFNGLLEQPHRLIPLSPDATRGLVRRGGTILGTTNRGNPFRYTRANGEQVDVAPELAKAVKEERLEGLVCIGGDGTQAIALQLMREVGIPVVGVPKTIDNDLSATDYTFGFQTAVDIATDALDRLQTTAESHDRVLFLEVMGRDAGHIALEAGIAGGADIILVPEIPYDVERVAQCIRDRVLKGRRFSVVIIAEGALPVQDVVGKSMEQRRERLNAGGGAANIAMKSLNGRIQAEMRTCVLGHIQRGGSPCAFDRVLATRFGVAASRLVDEGRWGEMVRLRNGHVDGVPIQEAIETYKFVDPKGELVHAARAIGVEFGG